MPLTLPHNLGKLSQRCQNPSAGHFDINDLEWESTVDVETPESVVECLIPYDRVQDFIEGESARGNCFFSISFTHLREEGSLKRVQVNSYLEKRTYCCEFGPEDKSLHTPEYEEHATRRQEQGGMFFSATPVSDAGCNLPFNLVCRCCVLTCTRSSDSHEGS